jgi:uncharacterized protein (TIGR00156 family)
LVDGTRDFVLKGSRAAMHGSGKKYRKKSMALPGRMVYSAPNFFVRCAMKKIIRYVVCMLILTAAPSPVFAKHTVGAIPEIAAAAGFSGPGLFPVTVKDIATMRDDAKVVLHGNIVQRLDRDKYLFRDVTGAIRVEIDDDKWKGRTIASTDMVEIYGEVDRSRNNVEIDVDRIVTLK